jgi:hypothetical protein
VGLTDTVSTQLTGAASFTRTVSDTVGLTDLGDNQAFDVGHFQDDLVGLTDTVTAVLTPAGGAALTRTVTDVAGLADAVTFVLSPTIFRSVTDVAGLVDAVTFVLSPTTFRVVDDMLELADEVTAVLTPAGTVAYPHRVVMTSGSKPPVMSGGAGTVTMTSSPSPVRRTV